MRSWGVRKTKCSAPVSSTVPRLDERCPPVAETDSTMNARSSVASWFSERRSRARTCAGSSMVSRRGKADMDRYYRSAVAVDDEIGKLREARSAAVERRKASVRVGEELLGELL